MKRELIECYYEAHMKEIQEFIKGSEIKEMDEEIRRLDQKLCEATQKKDPEFWTWYDKIMSLLNAMEDDMFKELYIRGFLDYERLVLECYKEILETR